MQLHNLKNIKLARHGLSTNAPLPVLGYSLSGGFAAQGAGWSVSYTYAALPSTFTAGGSILTAPPFPIIGLRVSG